MEKVLEILFSFEKAIEAVEDPELLKPVLCVMIDEVASKNGMDSLALMDELRPHIEMVNATMGNMES